MTRRRPHRWLQRVRPGRLARTGMCVGLSLLVLGHGLTAQSPKPAKETIQDGYAVHASVDLGGRVVDYSGSGAMYDTLINLQSGPRVLSQSLELRAVGKTPTNLFDQLSTMSTGYGGDPINVTDFHMSKGKLYDFRGLFRRDREYFDYNLLDNPLVPPGVTSNGYTFPQVEDSPHLFNTVRRMTDVNAVILPLSRVSLRAAYSQNISQGPSYTSQHNGAEALYLQSWRNSTDSWVVGVDWKLLPRTILTYEEAITHYKGNTSWQLAGLNMQLANGTPVTLGFDNVSIPKCGEGNPAVVSNVTSPPTANDTCSGYLQYSRNQPTRTLFPTEEVRFQSATIRNIQMNGRVRYTDANMTLPHYYEHFDGLDNMGIRVFTTTGNAKAHRANVSADIGAVWQVTETLALSEQYDYWNFHQPADGLTSEIDQLGSSLLAAPGVAQPPTVTSAHTFLGVKTEANTLSASWQASSRASISLGYRHRSREIGFAMPLVTDAFANGTAYTVNIRENGPVLGVVLRPTQQWRLNGNVEAMYANDTYTRISPRALQHYSIRSTYKPKAWATISGSLNDLKRRNNVTYINHLDHSRSVSVGASLTPNEHYGLDLSYGYLDIFSKTLICYAATPAPPGAGVAPDDCGTNTNLGNGYYDAPTQFGSIGITWTPVTRLHTGLGYRMSAVNGQTEMLNVRQPPGSLQSQYQSPYLNLAWTLRSGWVIKGDWNYYGYGEGSPIGPTSPRSFRGNIYTAGLHHEF